MAQYERLGAQEDVELEQVNNNLVEESSISSFSDSEGEDNKEEYSTDMFVIHPDGTMAVALDPDVDRTPPTFMENVVQSAQDIGGTAINTLFSPFNPVFRTSSLGTTALNHELLFIRRLRSFYFMLTFDIFYHIVTLLYVVITDHPTNSRFPAWVVACSLVSSILVDIFGSFAASRRSRLLMNIFLVVDTISILLDGLMTLSLIIVLRLFIFLLALQIARNLRGSSYFEEEEDDDDSQVDDDDLEAQRHSQSSQEGARAPRTGNENDGHEPR